MDLTRLQHQLDEAKQRDKEYNTPERIEIASDIEKHRSVTPHLMVKSSNADE